MNAYRLRLVVESEYRRRMGRRGFLLGAFLLPLLIIAAIVIAGYLAASDGGVGRPLAIVDHASVLADARQLPDASAPKAIVYTDEQAARAAVTAGEVAAAFVIESDYPTTGRVTSYSIGALSDGARSTFRRWLRWNLVAALPEGVAMRATDGIDLITLSLDGRREFSESTWPNIVVPFVAVVLFSIVLVSNASDVINAVVDEKESRTMEILVTSVSPTELVGGKILAILLVGVTQMIVWAGVVAVAISVARQHIPELSTFRLDWSFVWVMALTLIPLYVLMTALLAALGGMSSEVREGQQLSALVTVPMWIPCWFAAVLITNPNSPIAIALTLFPLTAPLSLSLRWGLGFVPPWQLALSIGILVTCAAGAVYAAARLFHVGMLRYGRRLSWAEVRQALATRRPTWA